MWTNTQSNSLASLLPYLLPQQRPQSEDKLPALPLEFEYIPVEIVSKEFTKLNSPHPYRIHYLGPRPVNTLALHKRYGRNDDSQENESKIQEGVGCDLGQYRVNFRRIINCNFTSERLQENHHYKSSLFYRAFEGMNPTLPAGQEMIFNSAFEGGNLDCVIKVASNQFDLFLRIDSNTRGHTAWYYFSIRNGNKKETITLNVCNLTKPSTLYEQGMKPYIFSRQKWAQNLQGWEQNGSNLRFQAFPLRYEVVHEMVTVGSSFRLSFDYTFEYQDDQVYFAYCVPYSYSQLQLHIKQYEKSPFVQTAMVGRSLSGLDLPIIHVTDKTNGQNRKKNIFAIGRLHPCESNGSHLLHGFITFLLGSSKEAEDLRSRSNFYIIPMVNPDGVILGNTRTSAAGKDLNRQFLTSKRQIYPEVYNVKAFAAKLQKKDGATMFIDFHGHSRRKNTFLYGPNYPLSHPLYYKSRVFPRLIEKVDPRFRFYSCSFAISEDKKSTARAVLLNQIKIPYCFTIQSSVGLYYHPVLQKTLAFDSQQWQEMGSSIALGLQSFVSALQELQQLVRQRKAQREKIKEQKSSMNRMKKIAQEEDKPRKANVFLDMIEDVKAVSSQPKNFQEQVDSDDHDEEEDFQSYKLREFNHLVVKGHQRQQKTRINIQPQEEFDNIQLPASLQEDQAIEDRIIEQISPRKGSNKPMRTEELRTIQTRQSKTIQVNRQTKSNGVSESLNKNKESKQDFRKDNKNFILTNKQRYSLATKNLFPIDDRCEILSLPKSIQIMRRQMKKGRLLINNLEQTRIKFQLGQEPFRQIKPLSLEQGRSRVGSRSSAVGIGGSEISPTRGRKSQSHLNDLQAYTALNGIEVDNLAMTITTFGRRR